MMRFLLTASVFLGTSLALLRADGGAVKVRVAATPYPRCTQQQCDQIHRGMSVDEATAVLRCPPGDYTGGKGIYVAFIDPYPVHVLRRDYAKYWCGHQGAIGLVLDKDGKVRRAEWYPALDPGSGR